MLINQTSTNFAPILKIQPIRCASLNPLKADANKSNNILK